MRRNNLGCVPNISYFIIFTLGWLILLSTSARSETLKELITHEKIDCKVCRKDDLNKKISSGAIAENNEARIIATYVVTNSNLLPDYFYVFRYDKQLKKWFDAELHWPMFDAKKPTEQSCSGGSILDILVSPNFIYLEGHASPSASCTMVITNNLTFHDTFYGWAVGKFTGDSVIFENSMMHFAPTHPLKLSLYDPITISQCRFFPTRPFKAIRKKYIAEVRRLYKPCCSRPQGSACIDPERFEGYNVNCDPELFDNYLDEIAINADNNAIAFINVLDDIAPSEKVVYFYRNLNNGRKLKYREILLRDLQKEYGELPLKDYLSKKILNELVR